MKFPTNYIILEGPDLAGKTTFYNELHKASGYRWNIHDRSYLSMIIHANQYNRPDFIHKENFKHELLNLNNKLVILLPDISEIIARYKKRGDEIQSLESVTRLHSVFCDYAKHLEKFPNVFVVKGSNLLENVGLIKEKLTCTEFLNLDTMSQEILAYVKNSTNNEATPLKFTLYDNGTFAEADDNIMSYEPEKDYYQQILNGILSKIENELAGRNQYDRVEPVTSRRFIYTNDSCISLIHASYRESLLDIHFVLRSSEVSTTFNHDLRFLYYLTKRVYQALKLQPDRDLIRLRFNLNSAHILK